MSLKRSSNAQNSSQISRDEEQTQIELNGLFKELRKLDKIGVRISKKNLISIM